MSSRTRTPPLWDPQTVLKIDNMGRCAGWARTRGRNCAMTIAYHNQQNADCLMKALSTKQPDPIALENDLYRLAGFVLCRRWHQNQADDLVDKWSARIERFVAAQEEIESARRARSARNSPTPLSRTPEASSPTTPPSLSGSELRAMQSFMSQNVDRIAQLEATIAALTARVAAPQEMPTTTTPTSPPASVTPPAQPAPPTSTSTSSQSAPPPRLPVTPPAPQRPPPTTTPPCTLRHVRRRAVDNDCPICHEAFLADEPLAWCKRECGRTVHKACFADWEKACRDDGRVVTCGICRAAWGRECGC
ncbi:hypothetical protein P171DRAFT_435915 [Karstenula rhodostoma CBS 690.94]|uniref:RING-type domain-containing protein n=1 Tax=Karstenula rhodostoma CBS 690.94 TaxID=1392251 RepID=A0A9P4P805_9PLEO|nr:hypothetical protein P171DRAFT_435915 [Karstenula rhodostoma CBS 690.94]